MTEQIEYRDVIETITRHSVVLVAYAIFCIFFTYAAGNLANEELIFVLLQVPTIVIATYAISPNSTLFFRVPFFWTTMGIIAWSGRNMVHLVDNPYMSELPIAVFCVLFVYIFVRSIKGAIREWSILSEDMTLAKVIGNVLIGWSILLQMAMLSIRIVAPFATEMVAVSKSGTFVLKSVKLIYRTSPVHWFPLGFIAMGILILASITFRDRRYSPTEYKKVLVSSAGIFDVFLHFIRIPIWIIILILEFVVRYVEAIFNTIKEFIINWWNRFLLILVAFAAPLVILYFGNILTLQSTEIISLYLASENNIVDQSILVFAFHLHFIVALCLYLIAIPPVSIEISTERMESGVFKYIRNYIFGEGARCAEAIGKTFALYGILIVVVPVTMIFLPGTPKTGLFTYFYSIISACGLGYMLLSRKANEAL